MVVKSAYKIISLTYNLSEEINLNDQFNSFSYHVDIEDLNMNLNTLQVALKNQINVAVRGNAMNPVDHPMGGGEGRASGGHPRSRKGLPAKGYKTRAKKNASNKYIVEKRKK